MENIVVNLENIKKNVESIQSEDYKDIFNSILDLLSDISTKVEETMIKQNSLEEYMGYIGDDLTDIQEELFEEVSIDDLNDMEDEYIEINCNNCGKPLFVEKQSVENNINIPCPFCNKKAN